MTESRWTPPPNWPKPPEGWSPPPGWSPDPRWGPPPDGWQFWQGPGGKPWDKMGAGAKPKSWFARHKILTALGALLGLGIVGGALGGEQPPSPNQASSPAASTSTSTPKPRATPQPKAAAGGGQEAPAAASGPAFPGKKDRDIAVKPGDEVQLSGWTATAGALKAQTDPGFGRQLSRPREPGQPG